MMSMSIENNGKTMMEQDHKETKKKNKSMMWILTHLNNLKKRIHNSNKTIRDQNKMNKNTQITMMMLTIIKLRCCLKNWKIKYN